MLNAAPAYDTKHLSPLYINLITDTTNVSLKICQSQAAGETGSTLWLSSQVLAAHFLDKRPIRNSSSILELGTGTGFLAVLLAVQGHQVYATDTAEFLASGVLQQTLSWNQDAVLKAGGKVSIQIADWHNADWHNASLVLPLADYIIATDVIYHPELIVPFLQILRRCALARPSPVIYFAQEVRVADLLDDFYMQADAMGFNVTIFSADKCS
ncbi:putative methyltransferase-domain-containing protein [Protomyces lactucae-debilis]|uniref:Putative methyltransferase-domain-containing protein n=1 Tax=Protomyces lactucae-debilis TaxID=2754530 RepID=A0A1Y2F5G2_PROLT|nr:putative methyltransferase-domain-containing protein [Protomyces lactucae-debilis]ORY79101.1 putative methyltransferase-domain-containing protein [Protomyces lactucae-debilis]